MKAEGMGKENPNPLLARLQMLYGSRDVLRVLVKLENGMDYETLKQHFPKAPKNLFDKGLRFLLGHSLLEFDESRNCYNVTQKAKEIFSEDVDLNMKVLNLLRLEPLDLNEMSALLQTSFDSITAVFISLAKESLVTSTTSCVYPRSSLGVGTPVIQLTTKGIEFLKKTTDSSKPTDLSIGTAQNVYVSNNITINNIQNTIDQLILQVEQSQDIDDNTKKELKDKLKNLKDATKELLEFAKTAGLQLTVEGLKKFFFS